MAVETTKEQANAARRDELLSSIRQGVAEIADAKANRTASNEAIGEVRARLETLGIPRKSLAAAMQYMDMDPDKRRGFDVAYALVREALGEPVDNQGDIIAFIDEKAKAEEKPVAKPADPTTTADLAAADERDAKAAKEPFKLVK